MMPERWKSEEKLEKKIKPEPRVVRKNIAKQTKSRPGWVKYWNQTPQPREYHYKISNGRWFHH